MRIAFYAPMKPLDNPVPSGDRQLGRLIKQAVENAGNEVAIASKERSWSRHGGEDQIAIRDRCEKDADALIERWRNGGDRPELWLTYHLYHKAPDWIGPRVSTALSLPYVVIEASRARKQMNGPWAIGFEAADRALLRADAAIALHEEDAQGLAEIVPGNRLFRVAPFIDASVFESGERVRFRGKNRPIRLVTVAMMRRGDKERSFRVLAEALSRLSSYDWTLTIAGDGEAREDLIALFPSSRTNWLGRVEPEELATIYTDGDIFVWPAVNEAFGLVFLEAQSAGMPVVAGRTGGVPDVVGDGLTGYLAREGDAGDFADALRRFLDAPSEIDAFGLRARTAIAETHTLEAGTMALQNVLDAVTQARHMGRDVAAEDPGADAHEG